MRYAISYVSTAKKDISDKEIEELLNISEEYNNREDITGILLFSEGNFFQVIEGEEKKVKSLYENIQKDKRHHNLIKIFEKPIHKASYDGYKSDFISENAHYDTSRLNNYHNYLQVLDRQTQKAVTNILKAFIR